MANTIIAIKRSSTLDEPSLLANGELAFSFTSSKLFIGNPLANTDNGVEYIGGRVIVDKVANLESIIIGGESRLSASSLRISGLANNSVLISTSNGEVSSATGEPGQILQTADDGVPVFDDLDGGAY